MRSALLCAILDLLNRMEQQRRETNTFEVADHVSALVLAASVDGCLHGRSYDQALPLTTILLVLQFNSSKIPVKFDPISIFEN